jgi:hypothetical protein
MFRFAICVFLAVLCRNSFAQEEFPFRDVIFQGASAFHRGENFEYFLFKRGFFKGVRDDEEATIIAEWTKQHPNAKVVPVSILGEKANFPIVYFWAMDGEDNLNILLVKKGVYPALAMLDTVEFKQLLRVSKNTRDAQALEVQERAGNPTGVLSRRLVSDPRYENFLKQLVAAETAAQAESNGIWSDKFKPMRDKMGITSLSATPFSILHIGSE